MARYEVILLKRAERDIRAILAYLSQYYESTPENFHILLLEKLSILEETPGIHEKYRDNPIY